MLYAFVRSTINNVTVPINLFGSFKFSPKSPTVDIAMLAAYYADPARWSRILRESATPNED